mmetsp:Transcript_4142/g.14091  ORF Transcript_4142/g.14091 Transcript_4142/m.14091 type:complete len:320 (+) Transcript_4142:3-962(+)
MSGARGAGASGCSPRRTVSAVTSPRLPTVRSSSTASPPTPRSASAIQIADEVTGESSPMRRTRRLRGSAVTTADAPPRPMSRLYRTSSSSSTSMWDNASASTAAPASPMPVPARDSHRSSGATERSAAHTATAPSPVSGKPDRSSLRRLPESAGSTSASASASACAADRSKLSQSMHGISSAVSLGASARTAPMTRGASASFSIWPLSRSVRTHDGSGRSQDGSSGSGWTSSETPTTAVRHCGRASVSTRAPLRRATMPSSDGAGCRIAGRVGGGNSPAGTMVRSTALATAVWYMEMHVAAALLRASPAGSTCTTSYGG